MNPTERSSWVVYGGKVWSSLTQKPIQSVGGGRARRHNQRTNYEQSEAPRPGAGGDWGGSALGSGGLGGSALSSASRALHAAAPSPAPHWKILIIHIESWLLFRSTRLEYLFIWIKQIVGNVGEVFAIGLGEATTYPRGKSEVLMCKKGFCRQRA